MCKCSRQYGLVGCHESYMKISIETNDQNRNSEGEPLEFRDRSSDRVFFFFFCGSLASEQWAAENRSHSTLARLEGTILMQDHILVDDKERE